MLGLEIEPNETEQKSYLDIKRFFQKTWPFMWDVKNTKDTKILVQNQYLCDTFSSYSYLDLVRDQEVQEFAIDCARAYASGNHGPRMLGGNTQILLECELALSRFVNKERTLTCSSGYLAAMSAVAALAKKGDIIFADQYCHASLRSGFTLSGA
jgi:7-keto-8-aminopelargonate synthetase-like enzyme